MPDSSNSHRFPKAAYSALIKLLLGLQQLLFHVRDEQKDRKDSSAPVSNAHCLDGSFLVKAATRI